MVYGIWSVRYGAWAPVSFPDKLPPALYPTMGEARRQCLGQERAVRLFVSPTAPRGRGRGKR